MNASNVQNRYQRKKGKEIYIKNQFQKDMYIKQNNREIYAFDFSKKRQILAKDENNLEFYSKSNDNEIYPVFLDTGFHRFVQIDNMQIYALDKFGNQKYPLNRSRKEKLAKNKLQNFYYAKFADGSDFYPMDDLKNEWAFSLNNETVIAVTSNNEPKVPISNEGKVKYLKKNNKEVLYVFENKPFYGKNVSGEETYPTDEMGNEYYYFHDSKPMIAKTASNKYKYALSKDRKIIFPRDVSGTEHYIEYFIGFNALTDDQADHFERYILSNEYPIKILH